MIVLFCRDPEAPRQPEPLWEREATLASELGAEVGLLDHDALVAGDLRAALAGLRVAGGRALYRGWMLEPARYERLHEGLGERGVSLRTSPLAYRSCHYFPAGYAAIEAHTPRSVWLPEGEGLTRERIAARLAELGPGPAIVKDYVKSLKHAWEEACFIPSASAEDEALAVVERFLAWQGESLAGGLVFREFVELAALGVHPQSGMPLTEEYRAVVYEGRVLDVFPYWEAQAYPRASPPPRAWLEEVAARVESPFFTLDVARRREGGWVVIELGDAQVAGLPPQADLGAIYAGLLGRGGP